MVGTCSSAHSAGAAIAGAASAGAACPGAAIAGAASAGAASAGPASANPASKQNPNPVVVCASAPLVCKPEAEPEPGGGVRFRYRQVNPKPNPNPAVACASAPPVCEPEAKPEQHLLSGDVTPTEDQRSPSADQGLPQQTSDTPCGPVCVNPNPVVACASAPPVSEPEADFLQRWRGLPRRRPV
jgi:hypothetical protein